MAFACATPHTGTNVQVEYRSGSVTRAVTRWGCATGAADATVTRAVPADGALYCARNTRQVGSSAEFRAATACGARRTRTPCGRSAKVGGSLSAAIPHEMTACATAILRE